jgi:MFS transporter, PPP family, 3-phenylpropionic acid transporter
VSARLRAFYFLYYGYVGATLGFLAPYLRGLGFSGDEIGAATMAAQLVAAPAALLWGHAADRLAARPAVLRVCAAGALIAVAFLPFARTPFAVGAVLVAHALFAGAVVPLVDSVSVEWAAGSPGRSYARTRVFGSIGFVLVAGAAGLLFSARGERAADPLMPWSAVVCVAGYAAAAQLLRGDPRGAAPLSGPSLRGAARLLADRTLLLVLGSCALHWIALAPYHLMYGILVRDHGLPSRVTGLGLSVGVLAEVAVLFAFPLLSRRASLGALLAASCMANALRWLLVSRAQSAAALVALQIFHGVGFGAWWGSSVEAMRRVVPFGMRSTGQALFSALVFGGGNAIGYALSGAGYERFGTASPLFAIAAGVDLAAAAMVVAAGARLATARPASA